LISACGPLDKPAVVKTHLRNMIIVPEMIHTTVAVYNGKVFNFVDIKPEMVGAYLGEFSITYRFCVFYFVQPIFLKILSGLFVTVDLV